MKTRLKLSLIFVVLCCSLQASAQVDLNRLVRTQQDMDKGTRQENKVEKKDVYSSVEDSQVTDEELPVEANCIEIGDVIVENDFLNDADTKTLRERGSGRCLGALGIGKLASDLQDHIIKSGYITTRIEIPEQDLSSKKLVLNVVPGKIEQVIIADNDVWDWILPFKSEDTLYIRDIEQGLEVLQRVPGPNVKINIEPGSKAGYSNVVIDTGRVTIWNARVWLNNWGDKGTGKILAGGAGYLYNLTKTNDAFYLSGTTNAEHVKGGYNSLSAYYSVPFGYWDYEVFYSYSESRQKINLDSYDFDYAGRNQYFSLKGSRTVYRDQHNKVSASAELFHRKVDYRLDDIRLKLQRRNMMNGRFALNYKQSIPGSMLDATLSYQRFLRWFGADTTPDMRSGDVSPHSNIINFDLNYIRLINFLPINAYYDLRLGAQYSPGGLTLQDRFSIGSRWSVRGFENSSGLEGTKGFYLQNTLNIVTGIKDLEWYLGADYGLVRGNAGNKKQQKLLGATTGLKGSLSSFNYDASLSTPLRYPSTLEKDKYNINFTVSYQL